MARLAQLACLALGENILFSEDALKDAPKLAQNKSIFNANFFLSLTNPISSILQVAFPNPAQPQSEGRGRETLLPIDLPGELRIPGGKTSGGRDRSLGFDATAPPLARSLPSGRTDGRTLATDGRTPAGDFAMAAASSTASSTAAASPAAAAAATAAATASSRMLSQLKKKLSRFTISQEEGPVCDSGIYCYGE